jgi:hypothetical protein
LGGHAELPGNFIEDESLAAQHGAVQPVALAQPVALERTAEERPCHQREREREMQSEVITGHPRPSEAIRGHQRSSEVIRGHPRPSEVITGHQRSSEVIGGHQRQSRT